MDQNNQKAFLEAVVGPEGAKALAKAAERSEGLLSAVFPRALMTWVDFVANGEEYEAKVPGTEIYLSFQKSDKGYTGEVVAAMYGYQFTDATVDHIAGALAVAIGGPVDTAVRTPELVKLSKSLDLLVKARAVREALQKSAPKAPGGNRKRIQLPGATAKPKEPGAAQAPQMQAPNAGLPGAAGVPASKPTTPKPVPGTAQSKKPKLPKLPGMKVTKSELLTNCTSCGKPLFTSCLCWDELNKSLTINKTPDGAVLSFGAGWDPEAVATLAEALGR